MREIPFWLSAGIVTGLVIYCIIECVLEWRDRRDRRRRREREDEYNRDIWWQNNGRRIKPPSSDELPKITAN